MIVRVLRAQVRDLSSHLNKVEPVIVGFIRQVKPYRCDGQTKPPRRISWRDGCAMVIPNGAMSGAGEASAP
jgi:hypothetical protein